MSYGRDKTKKIDEVRCNSAFLRTDPVFIVPGQALFMHEDIVIYDWLMNVSTTKIIIP
jgi:hypothetical protein